MFVGFDRMGCRVVVGGRADAGGGFRVWPLAGGLWVPLPEAAPHSWAAVALVAGGPPRPQAHSFIEIVESAAVAGLASGEMTERPRSVSRSRGNVIPG